MRCLAGFPLLAYSIKAARKANIDRVIVSTDSIEYAEIAKSYGAEVPFLRPAYLAHGDSADYEFIAHALDWMVIHETESMLPDLIVHLRPTTPLRDPRIIDQAIYALRSDDSATALRSIHEMPESAYKAFEIEGRYLKAFGSSYADLDDANAPRQGFPRTFYANGYVDVLRVPFIQSHRKIHGSLVSAFITPAVWEVDTEDDFAALEIETRLRPETVKRLFA